MLYLLAYSRFQVFFIEFSLKGFLGMKNKYKGKKAAHHLADVQEMEISSVDFASIGIACHALCLINSAGILKKLDETGSFSESAVCKFTNAPLVKAALVTLVGAKVLYLKDRAYMLSQLGKQLAKNIGLVTLPLIGYRKLFSKQLQILKNPSDAKNSDIDFASIALASIDFGANDLDPLMLDIFKTLKPKGTICDLGCGTGERLVKICKATKSPGLGIEKSEQVIKESKQYTKNCSNVEVVQGDITGLKDIWEDVGSVMMSFVSHDIESSSKCSKILRSFQVNFPRMQCLIIVDIVSLSEKMPTIMPGFDYVHGLQGIVPRNYEETLAVFKKANYLISQEISVPNMPNTFVWILKPNKRTK